MKPLDRVLSLMVLAMGLLACAVVILKMVLMLFLNQRAALPWLLPIGLVAFLLAWAAAW